MSNENNNPRRTGTPWALPSNTGPRIGRVGAWGESTPSSSRNNSSTGGRRIATLGDVASGGPTLGGGGGDGGHGHAHGDDEDEDEDEGPGDRRENWYAGGERSGISIQNPDRPNAVPGGNLVRDLLRRAAEAGPPTEPGTSAPRARTFVGGGHILGSDEVESSYVPDPNAESAEAEQETAIRHLTFWREGFSVEDGELMRYDDPANQQILDEINAGRAPPRILNVNVDQPVELRVVKRLQDSYVPSPRKAFSGQGQRLGSPAPGASSSSSTSEAIPGSFPTGTAGGSSLPAQRSAEDFGTRFEVDQTKPATSVQIRLADGTRMVARMNLTHTVGDIRNFINASRPENHARPYAIMTTFPNKTLEDDSQTIGAAGLSNAVVVQRWA
ncbi:hypothetical protein C8Q74DRAFT_1232451 [Fomes fomentarius]|nr:hypothetical protein C8Q74DRAFT_1232451 [Fomes fomentarius]